MKRSFRYVIVLSAFLVLVPFTAVAVVTVPTAAEIPALVIEDSLGNLLGPICGFDNITTPVVVIKDGNNYVSLKVRKDALSVKNRVYFSNANCTGTAYLAFPTDSSVSGIDEMQDVTYGMGPDLTLTYSSTLYRSTGTTATGPTTNSEWISVNPPVGNCNVFTTSGIDRSNAQLVVDFDDLYTPPFGVRTTSTPIQIGP